MNTTIKQTKEYFMCDLTKEILYKTCVEKCNEEKLILIRTEYR